MSMGRLLAAGRSLMGSQNPPNRYQMDRRVRLPRFGSTKIPFAADSRTAAALEITPPQPNMSASQPAIATPEPTSKPMPLPPAPPVSTRLRLAVRRLQEWCVEANPIPRLARPARSAFTPAARVTSAPIQSELSLEEVKVVRNDLSDADVEIVPARPARRADVAPLPEENAWSRLTTRIFVRTEVD